MKKFLFLAISSLLIAGSVSAQYYYPRRHAQRNDDRDNNGDFYQPTASFVAGVNVSNTVSSNNTANYGTGALAGFNAGFAFNLPILYPLSFDPEILYSQKGYVANTTSGDFTQRTQFIDVPLLAKFRVGPAFSIVIGPQVSYLLTTTNTFNNGFTAANEQYYNNTNGNNNKTFWDGVAGVNFDLSRSVELRVRYTIDMQETDSNGNTYVPNYENQVWQFGLGFKFQ